ncbi:MAG: four helix bundle protein [Planctomycetes bacterium]|nr:four helix bundle protein [Planctomycetota bacterium]
MASSYRDLVAWKKSMDLVTFVYRATTTFPNDERFGLISQMRRAAVSIPANIAEGFGRRNRPEFQRFIRNSRGSSCELETHIEIGKRLGYLNSSSANQLAAAASEVSRILNGLHASLERRRMIDPSNHQTEQTETPDKTADHERPTTEH